MKINLAEYGTHGCPRSITVAKAADGQIILATSNERCRACEDAGSTLRIGVAIEANRAEIAALPVSRRIDEINYE